MRNQPAFMSIQPYFDRAAWPDASLTFRAPRSGDMVGTIRGNDRFLHCAKQVLQARKEMASIFSKAVFRDSAWDIILELYVGAVEGTIIYVKQMIIASGERPATAVRTIARLEKAGLLDREVDDDDHRRIIVRISETGRQAMEAMLHHILDGSADPMSSVIGDAAA